MHTAYSFLKRYDRWIEIHAKANYNGTEPSHKVKEGNGHRPDGFAKWLKETTVPVYMMEVDPDVPASVRYPLREVADIGGMYLTSTVAFAIGLAILEGFEQIKLFGFDMSSQNEYAHQRPCIEWWAGIAKGRGIEIVVPPGSTLLKGQLYGQDEEGLLPMMIERMEALKIQHAQQVAVENGALGALGEARRLKEGGWIKGSMVEDFDARILQHAKDCQDSNDELQRTIGKLRELQAIMGAAGAHPNDMTMPDRFSLVKIGAEAS